MSLSPLLAVVPFFGGGILALVRRLVRQRAGERHQERVLAALGNVVDPDDVPRGSIGVVEGTLRLETGKGSLVSFHPHGTSLLEEPNAYAVTAEVDADVIVALGDGRIAHVVGVPQVLVGDEMTGHDATTAEASDFDRKLPARSGKGQLRVLHDGARVRIRGRIERAAAGYREGGKHYEIAPALDDDLGGRTVPLVAIDTPRIRYRKGVEQALGIGGVVLAMLTLCFISGLDTYERASQAARLDDASALADAAFADGRFADASALYPRRWPPRLREIEAHLVAGRREHAEEAIGRHLSSDRLHPDEAATLSCIRDHIRIGPSAGVAHDVCRPTPFTQYAVLLERGKHGADEEAAREIVGDLSAAIANPAGRFVVHPTGIERAALSNGGAAFPEDLALAAMEADLALFDAVFGKGAVSWSRLDGLLAAPRPPPGPRLELWKDVLALGALAAYHASSDARFERYCDGTDASMASMLRALREKMPAHFLPALLEGDHEDGIPRAHLRLSLKSRQVRALPPAPLARFDAVLADPTLAWDLYDLERWFASR